MPILWRFRRTIYEFLEPSTKVHFMFHLSDGHSKCISHPFDPARLKQSGIGLTNKENEIPTLPTILQMLLNFCRRCRRKRQV